MLVTAIIMCDYCLSAYVHLHSKWLYINIILKHIQAIKENINWKTKIMRTRLKIRFIQSILFNFVINYKNTLKQHFFNTSWKWNNKIHLQK